MEGQKSNNHTEFEIRKETEDTEMGIMNRQCLDSISHFYLDVDKDEFRKPKDFKNEELQDQFPRREVQTDMTSPNIRRLKPTIPISEEIVYKPIISRSSGYVTLGNPLLSPDPFALYSPEPARNPTFTFQTEYGVPNPNERVRKNSRVRMSDYFGEFATPNYTQSSFMQASPNFNHMGRQMEVYRTKLPQQDNFRLDEEVKDDPKEIAKTKRRLMLSQRKEKIQKYLKKRENRIWQKKISYDCRKKVADRRLRVKGRFVTKEQAFALLGATPEELGNNKLLQELITGNDNCSIVTSAQNMKIRNIQTLLGKSNKAKTKYPTLEIEQKKIAKETNNPDTIGNEGLRVEILKKDAREQTVEVKIETIGKARVEQVNKEQLSKKEKSKLPKLQQQIFQLKKLKSEEFNPNHIKYHKE
jgi:hypothetical protein